jgi:hypothetical protein
MNNSLQGFTADYKNAVDHSVHLSSKVTNTAKSNWVIRGLQRDVVYRGCPIAALYMSTNAGEGDGGCGVSANESTASCVHGAQINFGDLTPYLT